MIYHIGIDFDRRWPWWFSWRKLLPKISGGYDQNRITYTIGVTWLWYRLNISRYWNRNGCRHVW